VLLVLAQVHAERSTQQRRGALEHQARDVVLQRLHLRHAEAREVPLVARAGQQLELPLHGQRGDVELQQALELRVPQVLRRGGLEDLRPQRGPRLRVGELEQRGQALPLGAAAPAPARAERVHVTLQIRQHHVPALLGQLEEHRAGVFEVDRVTLLELGDQRLSIGHGGQQRAHVLRPARVVDLPAVERPRGLVVAAAQRAGVERFPELLLPRQPREDEGAGARANALVDEERGGLIELPGEVEASEGAAELDRGACGLEARHQHRAVRLPFVAPGEPELPLDDLPVHLDVVGCVELGEPRRQRLLGERPGGVVVAFGVDGGLAEVREQKRPERHPLRGVGLQLAPQPRRPAVGEVVEPARLRGLFARDAQRGAGGVFREQRVDRGVRLVDLAPPALLPGLSHRAEIADDAEGSAQLARP